jgi:hypothetical protein
MMQQGHLVNNTGSLELHPQAGAQLIFLVLHWQDSG